MKAFIFFLIFLGCFYFYVNFNINFFDSETSLVVEFNKIILNVQINLEKIICISLINQEENVPFHLFMYVFCLLFFKEFLHAYQAHGFKKWIPKQMESFLSETLSSLFDFEVLNIPTSAH